MTSWGVVIFVALFAVGLSRGLAKRTAHVVGFLVVLVVLMGAAYRQHAL